MTVLIVCGSDCSGKTTLIEKLRQALNYKVIKGSSFEQSSCSNEELYKKFDDMASLDDVIFDRFIYCNEVYAPLYKDFAMLSDEQRRQLEVKMKDKATIIYLEAELETLIERMNKRGDDYVTIDKLAKIKESYNESMSKVEGLEILKYNTTYLETDEIVSSILEKINNN